MTGFTRREALALAAVGVAGAAGCASKSTSATSGAASSTGSGLQALAAAKGVNFGTAISAAQLSDPSYVEIVRRECGVIVAENEFKMYVIQPTPGPMDFGPADAIAAFAADEGLGLRGHTLLWNSERWLPGWVNETTFASATAAEAALGSYIETVAARYAGAVYSWDVVNETIDPATGELRATSYTTAIGPEIIDFCFHAAKAAAPNATLVYNDYMTWEASSATHRAGVLRLLEGLVARGVPIDGLGIQSHSNYDTPLEFTAAEQREWRIFCDAVAAMGLSMHLTEIDVNDKGLPSDIATRDRAIASHTKEYLDFMLAYPQVVDVLMWGMVDKDNWLQGLTPRPDGLEKRPTLYDSSYRSKPMRDAVAAAFVAAPDRRAA